MTADEHDIVVRVPPVIVFFHLMASCSALGRAGRIFDPQDMHKPPEIPDHKKGKKPELIVDEISLMTVDHKNLLAGLPMLEDYRFVDIDIREEILRGFGEVVLCKKQVALDVFIVFQLKVMVAVKHIKPACLVIFL